MTRLRLLIRFPRIHRVVHRLWGNPVGGEATAIVGSCPICAFVWRTLAGQPDFFTVEDPA